MKSQKSGHKKKNQLSHVRIRAWERLGLHLSKRECSQIAKDVQNGNGKKISRISFTLSIWRVAIRDGQEIIVIYDHKTRFPATVLTERLWYERNYKGDTERSSPLALSCPLGGDPKIVKELEKLKGSSNERTSRKPD